VAHWEIEDQETEVALADGVVRTSRSGSAGAGSPTRARP